MDELIQVLTPIIATALSTMFGLACNALRKKYDSEAAHSLLDLVERSAELAVLEVEQTMLPKIRAALADDGKIDSAEAARLRDLATSRARAILGPKRQRELAKITDPTLVMNTAVEAKVRQLRLKA